MFQSLIGTLQTYKECETCTGQVWVSIPYRYATNEYRYFLIPRLILFQSLIGTLQTDSFPGVTWVCSRFQSLIGTLQTRECRCFLISRLFLFQSLIGTLQTRHSSHYSSIYPDVSIPYRYATNYVSASSKRCAIQMFQSLIGTLQTLHTYKFPEEFMPVSIPYRYATNRLPHPNVYLRLQSFNPLQVRYKPKRL